MALSPIRAEAELDSRRGDLAREFFAAFDAGKFDKPITTAASVHGDFEETKQPLLGLSVEAMTSGTVRKVFEALRICAANGITVAQVAIDALAADYVADTERVLELVEIDEDDGGPDPDAYGDERREEGAYA